MKLEVTNMTCNHCKMTIENALKENGFKDVKVDLVSKTVEFSGTDEILARKIITDKGYDVK